MIATPVYAQILELVKQLSREELTALSKHLDNLERKRLLESAQQRELSPDEKITLIRLTAVDVPVNPNFSDRREDWYDDDGR